MWLISSHCIKLNVTIEYLLRCRCLIVESQFKSVFGDLIIFNLHDLRNMGEEQRAWIDSSAALAEEITQGKEELIIYDYLRAVDEFDERIDEFRRWQEERREQDTENDD